MGGVGACGYILLQHIIIHLLLLDLVLEGFDRVSGLHVHRNRLSGQRLHEQLHAPSQPHHLWVKEKTQKGPPKKGHATITQSAEGGQ